MHHRAETKYILLSGHLQVSPKNTGMASPWDLPMAFLQATPASLSFPSIMALCGGSPDSHTCGRHQQMSGGMRRVLLFNSLLDGVGLSCLGIGHN